MPFGARAFVLLSHEVPQPATHVLGLPTCIMVQHRDAAARANSSCSVWGSILRLWPHPLRSALAGAMLRFL
eukprot:15379373-Alexandrium_andersonii.AAC.1